jgi:FdhE protein
MEAGEQGLQVLRALMAAREKHEELADLLDFYYDLYEVQFEAKASVPEPEVRDELAARWRLEGGIPQLTFERLGIDPVLFGPLVSRVMGVLIGHNPQWESKLQDHSSEELVGLAREIFETWDTLTAPRPDADATVDETLVAPSTMLAVGFAMAPYLQLASEAILPELDLKLWTQGYCPICGGRPNFAVLVREGGARELVCSRCNSLWPYSRLGCPRCGSKEKQQYYPSEDGIYRLYVCPDCNRYLKTMDLREVHREVLPPVERLLTVGMDLAAHQEGYGD